MATKTQFLPYAHRYQDSTAGLRDALTNIQAGINQRGALRIHEADQKIKQDEADRLTAQRSFLANYQPTLSEDHLTNEGLERYNSLIEHNKDRLSAMDDSERETVRQKLLRETADSNRVARTVREDIMGSGFFNPTDVDVLATSYGSGYTDFAAASKAAHDAEATDARNRAELFKNATIGLGKVFGNGNTGANGASAATDFDTQALLAAGAPDPKTGKRPGFPESFNNQNDPLLKRYNGIFQDDPRKDRYIDLLENRGLVTYQKNALTPEFIDELAKVATADNSLGWYDNASVKANVEAGVRAYYHKLNETNANGDGYVAAPPPEVLRQVLFDGIKKGGFLSDAVNNNANAFFASSGAAEIGALFEKAHDKYLEDSEKELEALLKRMADQNFDFYGTKFPELNQKFYGEKPALSKQDLRTLYGRTETGGSYAAPTQAVQQPAAVTQGLGTQGQPVPPAQQLEQLRQAVNLPADVKEEHFGGLEAFPSPESFTAVMLPMAEGAAARIGVSPQHLLAQTALETGWGKRPVVSVDGKPTYNLFGIKAYGNWNGPSALVNTTEVENGNEVPKQEPFRVYNSFAESFEDYVNFLQQNPRYSKALEAGAAGDGPAFLDALADAGYATDTNYKKKLQGVLRSVERRIPEGYTPGSFVASPIAQQQANTQVAGTQQIGSQLEAALAPAQQGHPATEHLRALLNTYPQPYTEKSFTYDKIDAAFRRLGLTVPAAEKVQANLTPVAAGVGSFPRMQVEAPVVPAAQPTPAAVPVADVRADPVDADGRNMAPSVPVDWEGRNNWKTAHQAHLENMLSSMEGSQDPRTMLLREYMVRGLATGNREAEMLIDRELTAILNKKEAQDALIASSNGYPVPPPVMPPELEELPALEDLDQEFLRERIALMSTEPLRETRHARAEEFRRLTKQAQIRKREFERESQERERRALAEFMRNQPVQGEFSDILWRAGPGEVPINFGPFVKMRHLPTDRNIDPPVYDGPGTARSAWEQVRSELFPSTQNTTIGPPQTAAPESRFSPPMLPEPVKSLPERREESSNNFLMLRQDRQQELRDLIDSRTNQGISNNQQPEQEAAEETTGVSERYQMLADIIREFQQGVGNNRRMTLGNIA